VKQRKDDQKRKRTDRARRKEEHEKRWRMQREVEEEEEEESSEEEDDEDDDDDDEGVHPYNWLDSLAEKGEQPEGLSLSIEGRTPQAQLLLHEPEDPNLGGAAVASGRGGEPPKLLGSARPKGTGGSRSQEMVGSPLPPP
jgi:hypothetical protein